MVTQEKLKSLVKTIKAKTGLKQEEISIAAGYARKTLTQRISQGEELESVYDQLNLVFKEKLNNSTHKGKKAPSSYDSEANSSIARIAERLKNLEASSDETNLLVKALMTQNIGYSEAIAQTLDKVAKNPADTTVLTAGTIEQRIWRLLQEKGIDAIVRR